MLGEERYTEGRFDEAVALWGHALLQLPADPSADIVRHKLVARMGYGLLQAHHATGDMSYLVDGQAMCELYVAKHEELFGDTEEAAGQRGEIYELLYEFDSRLDVQVTMEEQSEADEDDKEKAEDEDTAEVTVASSAADPPTASPGSKAPELEDGEEYRLVKVRRIDWADPDDPRVRAFLLDERFTGSSLVDYGYDQINAGRVLVRVGALPRPVAAKANTRIRGIARQAGLAAVEAARPALQRCYEVAMTRDPVTTSRVEVTLTVEADGSVTRPRLVDGSVIDAQGDVCTIEALADTQVESASLDAALDVTIPLHFFYQDPTRTAALFPSNRPVSGRAYERTSGVGDLPPIDEFMSSEPAARMRQILKRRMSLPPRGIPRANTAKSGDARK